MKVLVTGGGGFVGRSVVRRLLDRGYAVRSLGRSARPDLEAEGVEVHCGDLAELETVETACQGVEAVFHVAAKAGVWGTWEEYFRPNVLGTRNVLAACRSVGIGRLVYTSTPSVVFNGASISGADEGLPYGRNWLCHYAHTKAIAEQEVLTANGADLRVVALRPHLVFGPGDPHLWPRVVSGAVAGRLRIIGSGDSRVDVAYVDNVADAHLNALDALEINPKVAGNAYFISQGEPVSLWPWINGVLEALGHPPVRGKLPLPVGYALGASAEALWKLLRRKTEPPITRFVAVELAKDHYFNIAAARRDLHFEPKVSMDAALSATVNDLKARGFGQSQR